MNFAFYIAAVVAVVSTALVITNRNAVHALLYLIVSLLSVALAFFTLGAPFVAALEVVIYAGAIMVLFVFVVMMLNIGPRAVEQESQLLSPGIWAGPAILAVALLSELVYLLLTEDFSVISRKAIPPQEVGALLFGPYMLGVELASILLLAGLVGAYHIGHSRRPENE